MFGKLLKIAREENRFRYENRKQVYLHEDILDTIFAKIQGKTVLEIQKIRRRFSFKARVYKHNGRYVIYAVGTDRPNKDQIYMNKICTDVEEVVDYYPIRGYELEYCTDDKISSEIASRKYIDNKTKGDI